jgi:hypothetical protein
MVMINRSTKEVTIKIVYYGPGLCGKTTNLEYIYQKAVPDKRGKLLTVATETDRTLFFDFLPMDLGTIRGMRLRVQLYTVPGQVFYDATRRIVLRGSDGLVFVADSQPMMMEANVESVNNLKKNLELNNLDPETIPLVFQYNKQDLNDLTPLDELESRLNWRHVPYFLSVATVGKGVNETLKKIIELVVRKLHDQDAVLKGARQQMAPPVAGSAPARQREQQMETPAEAKEEEAAGVEEAQPAGQPAGQAERPQEGGQTAPPPVPEEEPEVERLDASDLTPEPIALIKPVEVLPETVEVVGLQEPSAAEAPLEIEAPEEEMEAPAVEGPPSPEANEAGQEPEAVPVLLEPERGLRTDIEILEESLAELEIRAMAMAQDIRDLKATVAAIKEKAR